jgi:fructokinase
MPHEVKLSYEEALAGAIEAGGSKVVCAVGTGPRERMLAKMSFPTGDDPARLLATAFGWLKEQERRFGSLRALGIASFGPVDLDPGSPTYGSITSTPKPGWRNVDIVGEARKVFATIPIGFDTDVGGAALGESAWGQAAGLSDFVYITIGTGIGAGAMAGGRLVHGLVHPEMGHMLLPRIPGDSFPGICPFHGACWEGLCSGPALQARTGMRAEDIPADHPAWVLETQYIGYAITNIVCVLSPQRVILGGGVRRGGQLGEEQFFRWIRDNVRAVLNMYIASPALSEGLDGYIVPPGLGDDAGICGALALGQSHV